MSRNTCLVINKSRTSYLGLQWKSLWNSQRRNWGKKLQINLKYTQNNLYCQNTTIKIVAQKPSAGLSRGTWWSRQITSIDSATPDQSFHLVAGIHHGRVLSSDVDRRTAKIRRSNRDPAAQQPDGQQDLDPWHLLPEWQEVDFSQHDHPQQAVPHYAERNNPLHHEVTLLDTQNPTQPRPE